MRLMRYNAHVVRQGRRRRRSRPPGRGRPGQAAAVRPGPLLAGRWHLNTLAGALVFPVRLLRGVSGCRPGHVMAWRVLVLLLAGVRLAGVRLAGVMAWRAVFGQGWPWRVVLLYIMV